MHPRHRQLPPVLGWPKQAASAAGEGAAFALGIRKYLESHASGLPRREDIEEMAAAS
ncbi:MAG: hypothetical protein WD904_13740 [Dehalococcoidia bacterium]